MATQQATQNKSNLQQQAEKAFPLVFPEQESSVMHARKKWEEAQQYLKERNLSIKPVITIKQPEQSNVVSIKTKAA